MRPELDAAGERRWSELLASCDVAFDFDWHSPADLIANAPRLRWVQATSAGIGEFVRRYGLARSPLVLTTAAGVHAAPLAEFALAGVLHFVKDVPRLQGDQRARRWERRAVSQVSGLRATVVGLGAIGREVAQLFDLVGMRVTGIGRPGRNYDLPPSVRPVSTEELDEVLAATEVLVLACPLTDETRGLISAGRLAALPAEAIVVNLARGQVVDEPALISALASSRLRAVLDVFATEPLPSESPLWTLPNVLVSPHSASTTVHENDALTDLFVDNLGRYLAGQPLRNVYDRDRGY